MAEKWCRKQMCHPEGLCPKSLSCYQAPIPQHSSQIWIHPGLNSGLTKLSRVVFGDAAYGPQSGMRTLLMAHDPSVNGTCSTCSRASGNDSRPLSKQMDRDKSKESTPIFGDSLAAMQKIDRMMLNSWIFKGKKKQASGVTDWVHKKMIKHTTRPDKYKQDMKSTQNLNSVCMMEMLRLTGRSLWQDGSLVTQSTCDSTVF